MYVCVYVQQVQVPTEARRVSHALQLESQVIVSTGKWLLAAGNQI